MKEIRVRILLILAFAAVLAAAFFMILGIKDADTDTAESEAEQGQMTYFSFEYTQTSAQPVHDTEPEIGVTETVPTVTEEAVPVIADETDESEYPETEEPENGTTAPETTRYIVTSRPNYAFDDVSCYIDMENVQQNPELPTGCEITALTILLRFWGYDADKVDMAKNYLYKSWGNVTYRDGEKYSDSFFEYFIGDPFGRGYGCFAPAIVKTANKYLTEQGSKHKITDLSGCDSETLYNYVAEGIPVLVWATDGMIPPEYYESWYDNETGERLDWYLNEHCFVLAGFNLDAGTVTMNDPIKGIIDYNMAKFEQRFAEMHRQAAVILPTE